MRPTNRREPLPHGVVARIDVTMKGVRVNLRHEMPTQDFAALLHEIANAYEEGTIKRTDQVER